LKRKPPGLPAMALAVQRNTRKHCWRKSPALAAKACARFWLSLLVRNPGLVSAVIVYFPVRCRWGNSESGT